jgi:hypothetical protein
VAAQLSASQEGLSSMSEGVSEESRLKRNNFFRYKLNEIRFFTSRESRPCHSSGG